MVREGEKEMVRAKKLPVVWTLCMGVIVIFLMYYLIAPSIFYEERTAKVSCPVVGAATVVTKRDGGGETSRRAMEIGCDYSVIGIPRFLERAEKSAVETHLRTVAEKLPGITNGDLFVCTASWIEYSPLAFVNKEYNRYLRFDLESCRLVPR